MPAQIYSLDDAGRRTRPADPLTGHREESWRVDLLNNQDVVLTELHGVKGGDFSFNANAVIRGSGTIEYLGAPIDWNLHRVQPWYRAEAGGEVVEWPLGVFLVATPSTQFYDGGKTVSLEMYDKTKILEDDLISSSYQVKKGVNVLSAVRAVLSLAGQTRTAFEESTQTLSTAMVWPAGTSRLRIINDLLESANYFSIWVDGDGVFRTSQYLSPADRGMSWAFVDDSKSIYSPDFTHDFDTFDVPNRVIVTGQSDGDTPAPVAVSEDNSGGPFSIPTRGRVISRYEEGQEASDQTTLQGIADRLLQTGQQVGSTYSIKHAPIPLNLNTVAGFIRESEGVDVRTTVQQISYSMNAGALCSTTLREFIQ
ncbi:tail protein [Arthrobacter phage 1191A]|nr:tail protein [Arthrobacter phage 1191A]